LLWQVEDNDVVATSLEDPSLGYYNSTIITSCMNLVVMNQLRGHYILLNALTIVLNISFCMETKVMELSDG
jgi:hypothetical protein